MSSKREIELNKRPPGTRVIDGAEKARTIKQLESARSELTHGIENMSVSLYTTRAKN